MKTDNIVRAITEEYRLTGDDAVKRRSMAFVVPARCNGMRSSKNITAMTGLSLFDADHVPPEQLPALMERAKADPHTLLCYVTISGQGMRVIYRYELSADEQLESQKKFYRRVFTAGTRYYEALLGVEGDAACKDTRRASTSTRTILAPSPTRACSLRPIIST
jgi:hypothetical protein